MIGLNAFPQLNETSGKLFPYEIMTEPFFLKQNSKGQVGSYVEENEDANVINKEKPRTHACIAFGPSCNLTLHGFSYEE